MLADAESTGLSTWADLITIVSGVAALMAITVTALLAMQVARGKSPLTA